MLVLVLAAAGCGSEQDKAAAIGADLTLDPSPPVVGLSKVTLKLTDAAGKSLQGAKVKVEGNMNHAGMKPSFADMQETAAGTYSGTLDFTMAGDWFVLITGQTVDGERIEQKIDVKGVRAK